MDIERLLKKRQLNVQEQITLTAHKIAASATFWRDRGIPLALAKYAESQGIDWSKTIVLKLEVDFPGMPNLFGVLLSQAERFIAFELETDTSHRALESVERWEDVSAQQDRSVARRGVKKGYGAIALEVRREVLGVSHSNVTADER